MLKLGRLGASARGAAVAEAQKSVALQLGAIKASTWRQRDI